jgi:hypothetical protein
VRLSIVVVAYNMAREIPRTLRSLARPYQQGVDDLDYEIILVDNGSTVPLQREDLDSGDVPLTLLRPEKALPSPAAAVNLGIRASRGDLLCLMIDGAHLLTPGVLRWTLRAFAAFENPLVASRYFYLGPGDQPETIKSGYDQAREDELLDAIDWPAQGYRLFEIGAALRGPAAQVTWLHRVFESNCLTLRRDCVERLGGMDEAFDLPGGGFVNLDFFKRACELDGVELVQLMGEGCFHQFHGGTTTNSAEREREERLLRYREQYRRLRGHDDVTTRVPVHFLGHLPCEDAKIHRYRHGSLAARRQ